MNHITGTLLDGNVVAQNIMREVAHGVQLVTTPLKLVALSVGDNSASRQYLGIKKRRAAEVGIGFELYEFPNTTSHQKLYRSIDDISARADITACIIQLPLPAHLDVYRQDILDRLVSTKDVDVLTSSNKDLLSAGKSLFLPPTPAAILQLLKEYHIDIQKHSILLLGQGQLVGKPLSHMLSTQGCTYMVADETSTNTKDLLKKASLIISATGQPGLIGPADIQEGVILIDAGASEQGGKIVGDINPKAYTKASYYTPVPGGVGPVTVAMLLKNVVKAGKTA